MPERSDNRSEAVNGNLVQRARDILVKSLIDHPETSPYMRENEVSFSEAQNSHQVFCTLYPFVPQEKRSGISKLLATWAPDRERTSDVIKEIRGALERSEFEIPAGY